MLIEADTNGGEVSTALGGEVSMALDKIVERLRAAIGEYD
jgi:hypothetical protein